MFAIAFDLKVADAETHHPKGATQAYAEIKAVLTAHGFEWRQGSVYTNDSENLATLFFAVQALKTLSWFPQSVRDIRAFRVEQWSDFATFVKS